MKATSTGTVPRFILPMRKVQQTDESGNRKIQPVVEAPSLKLQAPSLTTNPGPCRINLERRNI